MYIFYRFENFAEMETKNFINAEEKCLILYFFLLIVLKFLVQLWDAIIHQWGLIESLMIN